jgi:hypothetical protein
MQQSYLLALDDARATKSSFLVLSGMFEHEDGDEAFTAEEFAQWLSDILLKEVFDHPKFSFACIAIAVDNVEQQEVFKPKFETWIDERTSQFRRRRTTNKHNIIWQH